VPPPGRTRVISFLFMARGSTMKTKPLVSAGALGDEQDKVSGLWTIDEFASFIRLSRKAAYALVAGTTVPRVRIGVRLRFQPQAVQAWIRAHACGSGTKPSHDGRSLSKE